MHPCRGCLYCWKNEAGKCAISDDMEAFIQSYLSADIVAWAFGDYFYGMPSTVKMVLERLLPLEYPGLEEVSAGKTKHFRRVDLSQKQYLLFVTCGFYNRKGNTDAIEHQFAFYYPNQCQSIICTEGELLRYDFMRAYTVPYLNALKKAGQEYAQGGISEAVRTKLDTPMLDLDRYLAFTNTNAVIRGSDESEEAFSLRQAKALMELMAMTYEANGKDEKPLLLEIEITDRNYTCQLKMHNGACTVCEPTEPYHLKVVAPMQFFRPKQTLDEALKKSQTQMDFTMLVSLTQRCAATGKSKIMRFGC